MITNLQSSKDPQNKILKNFSVLSWGVLIFCCGLASPSLAQSGSQSDSKSDSASRSKINIKDINVKREVLGPNGTLGEPGEPSDQGLLPDRVQGQNTTSLKPREKKIFGQIRVESMQYLTAIKEAPDLTNSQLLSARLSGADNFERWENISYAMDLTAGSYFSWPHSHFYVNESYLKFDMTPHSDVTVGRRKFDWSELDTRWSLGLWQPQFTLDALRPEDQGLTGVFFDYRQEKQEFLVMGTPVFIPTMGPEIREEGGSLVSDSRWYRSPSNKWNFNNQATPIVYHIEVPGLTNLVSNPGVAAMYRAGSKSDGPRLTVAAAYKPVNDLLLKREIDFYTNKSTAVSVSPDVTYHRLYSADAGYGWGPFNSSLSYMGDDVDEKLPPDRWAIQKLNPLRIYSANFDVELSQFVSRPLSVQTSYMRVFGGDIQDIESDGSPNEMTLFDSRTKFTNAVMVRFLGELAHPNARSLTSKFSYIYDYDQRGSIWGLEFQYSPVRQWGVVVGGDILGVENESDTDKRFINQFRANDRYYAGMSYVF